MLLEGNDVFGSIASEPLQVELLDELVQRHLSWFLVVIVNAAELLRVQAQLARHLHVGVG
jgi:hypothetical protein